jgi:hypothetical protein
LKFLKTSAFINEFANSLASFGSDFVVWKTQDVQTLFGLLDHCFDDDGNTLVSNVVAA